MFHRRFLEITRQQIEDVEPNAYMVSDEQWSDAIEKARHATGVALPTGAMFEEGMTGAFFDGHRIQSWRDWFKTPDGQAFKAFLKKLIAAIIIGIISGS